MMRPATLILFSLAAVAGAVLFGIAYEVSTQEDRLLALNKQIAEDRDAIHVLRAEWAYLNQPERLEELSQRYLDLQPLNSAQLAAITTVPPRAPSADDAPAETVPVNALAQDTIVEPVTEPVVASMAAAAPKAKPTAPQRQREQVQLAARPAQDEPVQTAAADAREEAALDAALRAIFGNRTSASAGRRR